MRKEILRRIVQKTVRHLVLAIVIFGPIWPIDARAQDAMSDRYAAIRAPTEAMVDRIAQHRLRAELNTLTRERIRVQGRVRQTEYLRLLDPVSGLAAAERALDGRLDRIGADLRETRVRLADHARGRRDGPPSVAPSMPGLDPEYGGLGAVSSEFDDRPVAESVDAARTFVEDLLRANRARP